MLDLDIAGHSSLPGTDLALQAAKVMLRKQAEGIASIRGGKLFQWAGDGGAFMFLTGNGEGFDDVAFTAMQILGTLPAINEEIHARTDLEASLAVRICCDRGMATYHTDAGNITGDFINKFMKNERAISIANTISITERVWKQLSAAASKLFDPFKHSDEVDDMIYNRGGKVLRQRYSRQWTTERKMVIELANSSKLRLSEVTPFLNFRERRTPTFWERVIPASTRSSQTSVG